MNIIFSFFSTFIIIFIVPILIYGSFVYFLKIKEPEKKLIFFFGVSLQKFGTAMGFVTLFYLGKEHFVDNWFQYGLVWFLMFAMTEIGQAFLDNSPKKEMAAGIISEAIYFPLSAFIISLLIK